MVFGGIYYVSNDIFHRPAANLTVVAKDDEACQNTGVANSRTILRLIHA